MRLADSITVVAAMYVISRQSDKTSEITKQTSPKAPSQKYRFYHSHVSLCHLSSYASNYTQAEFACTLALVESDSICSIS